MIQEAAMKLNDKISGNLYERLKVLRPKDNIQLFVLLNENIIDVSKAMREIDDALLQYGSERKSDPNIFGIFKVEINKLALKKISKFDQIKSFFENQNIKAI